MQGSFSSSSWQQRTPYDRETQLWKYAILKDSLSKMFQFVSLAPKAKGAISSEPSPFIICLGRSGLSFKQVPV